MYLLQSDMEQQTKSLPGMPRLGAHMLDIPQPVPNLFNILGRALAHTEVHGVKVPHQVVAFEVRLEVLVRPRRTLQRLDEVPSRLSVVADGGKIYVLAAQAAQSAEDTFK